jgi:endogenous inhibitor of DNA gyrase (YacG/DUF329 family)
MKIACPACGAETQYNENKFRPFCSYKCKNRDLINWAGERYKIPLNENEEKSNGIEDNGDTSKIIP